MTVDLLVDRFYSTNRFTLGRFIDRTKGEFLGFTLEDPPQEVKIPGNTRIPPGVYELALRPAGGKYHKYLNRFGEWQKPGMLWIKEVPDFTWILIHPGNTNRDTEGCLLVGDGANREGYLYESTDAYTRIYKEISTRMLNGEPAIIEYQNNES